MWMRMVSKTHHSHIEAVEEDTQPVQQPDRWQVRFEFWWRTRLLVLQNILWLWRQELVNKRTANQYQSARTTAIRAVEQRREWGLDLPRFGDFTQDAYEDRYGSTEDRY